MRLRSLATAAALSLGLAIGVAPLASAASLGGADRLAGTATTPYCSFDLSTGRHACADTEAAMIAARDAARSAQSTTYVLAKLYDNNGRTGPYAEIDASGPCDTNSDVDWSTTNIGIDISTYWNDRISSFQGYSNCQIRIYENANFGGASYGTYTSSNYVGDAMNDRTTSLRYY